jgi:hypothetical protein
MIRSNATPARRLPLIAVENAGSLTYRTLSLIGAVAVTVFLTAGCDSPTGPSPIPAPGDGAASTPEPTPTPAPDPEPEPFRVTNATISLSPDEHSDICPVSLQRTINITVNGPGTIRWALKSNSGTIGEFEHDFAEAGTLTVNETQDHQSSKSGWLRVKILEPNDLVSNTASYEVSCVAKVTQATVSQMLKFPLGSPSLPPPCPVSESFFGYIKVEGVGFDPTEVRYRFRRSDGEVSATQTYVVDQAGSKHVSFKWSGLGLGPERWVQLEVLAPNAIKSNKYKFKVSCMPKLEI